MTYTVYQWCHNPEASCYNKWYICNDTGEKYQETADYGYNETIQYYLWSDRKWRKSAFDEKLHEQGLTAYFNTREEAINHLPEGIRITND